MARQRNEGLGQICIYPSDSRAAARAVAGQAVTQVSPVDIALAINSTWCYRNMSAKSYVSRVFKTAWFAKAYSGITEAQLSTLLSANDLTEICNTDEAKTQK
jgi:hypothetical protein